MRFIKWGVSSSSQCHQSGQTGLLGIFPQIITICNADTGTRRVRTAHRHRSRTKRYAVRTLPGYPAIQSKVGRAKAQRCPTGSWGWRVHVGHVLCPTYLAPIGTPRVAGLHCGGEVVSGESGRMAKDKQVGRAKAQRCPTGSWGWRVHIGHVRCPTYLAIRLHKPLPKKVLTPWYMLFKIE